MPMQYTTQFVCHGFQVKSGVLVSAMLNLGALLFILFANRHYNALYAIISGKLPFIFWIIADMVPLFLLLLPNEKEKGAKHA